MRRNLWHAAAIAAVAACFGGQLAAKPLGKSAHGKPDIKSIEVIAFGPEGTLLIGDGASNSVFAVATGEAALPVDARA